MKLAFKVERLVFGTEVKSQRALPRVTFDSPDEQEAIGSVVVSLSRVSGSCNFSLAELAGHDDHAPGWQGNGESTNLSVQMTMAEYMLRIAKDIKSAVPEFTGQFNVTTVDEPIFAPVDAPGPLPVKPLEQVNWDAYGVKEGDAEEEEEDSDGE